MLIFDIPIPVLEGFELELALNGRIWPCHGWISRVIDLVGVERSQKFRLDFVHGAQRKNQSVVLQRRVAEGTKWGGGEEDQNASSRT